MGNRQKNLVVIMSEICTDPRSSDRTSMVEEDARLKAERKWYVLLDTG